MTHTTPSSSYRMIWRWHFYAGLFCVPFILWLATTGSIYLFKPQIEAWLDRDVDHLVIDGPRASAEAQVQAALAAVPGARFAAYELPATPQSAARVIVSLAEGTGREKIRVYVDPQRLTVLKQVNEEDRLMRIIFRLLGELLIGDPGSYLVELAASWAIVMLLTGLYLWWPRNAKGLAGVLYPRLGQTGRVFWRDLHSVIGLWVSVFALFLLLSGLPWAKFWGSNLRALRQIGSDTVVKQDWSTGREKPGADAMAAGSEHTGHHHGAAAASTASYELAALDRIVATVAPLSLAPPVLIAPPARTGAAWTAKSDAQNRPLRVNLTLDGETGAITKREDFAQRALLDRIIGTGVAAHEGQLFGWANQALGVSTALGLITLSVSALVMWTKRRPVGVLGAPKKLGPARLAPALIGLIAVFGVLLPMLGISLLLVLLIERLVLSRVPRLRDFLGLAIAAG